MPEVVNNDTGSLPTGPVLLRKGDRVRIDAGDGRSLDLFVTEAMNDPAGCRAYFQGQDQIPVGPIRWAKTADHPFDVGASYSRSEIRRRLGDKSWAEKGGKWATGHTSFYGRYIIFANIQTAGRTGHNYGNRWDELAQELEWSGKTGSRIGQPEINRILGASGHVLLFTRHDALGPFIFRGCGVAKSVQKTTPVRVTWAVAKAGTTDRSALEQLATAAQHRGQAVPPRGNDAPPRRSVAAETVERDPEVHAWVVTRASGKCEVCRKPAPFQRDDGTLYLEVHHLQRLADGGPDTPDNAVAVCANCHRELHGGARRKQLLETLYHSNRHLCRYPKSG